MALEAEEESAPNLHRKELLSRNAARACLMDCRGTASKILGVYGDITESWVPSEGCPECLFVCPEVGGRLSLLKWQCAVFPSC